MRSNHRHLGSEPLQMDLAAKKKPSSGESKSFSDILLMRRLRLNKAKTTTASSLSDSLSDTHTGASGRPHPPQLGLRPMASNASTSLFRNNSTNSYQSARSYRSTRSNATTLTALTSVTGNSSSGSGGHKKGKTEVFNCIVSLLVYDGIDWSFQECDSERTKRGFLRRYSQNNKKSLRAAFTPRSGRTMGGT